MRKYDLAGIDGNAFSVMGYVIRCMKSRNMDQESIDNYLKEVKSCDYNHLLAVSAERIELCTLCISPNSFPEELHPILAA